MQRSGCEIHLKLERSSTVTVRYKMLVNLFCCVMFKKSDNKITMTCNTVKQV